MQYDQYIVKKRLKEQVICGHVNIPYGTVCAVQGDFICHNGKTICTTTSQVAKEHFWGYARDNPDEEIERQKLVHVLFGLSPADSGDELSSMSNPWRRYGSLNQLATGLMWEWNKNISDFPTEKLEYLISCVKKGERPVCLEL